MIKGPHSSLKPIHSGVLHIEPLSIILALSVNDPIPDLPYIYRSVLLGLGTHYIEKEWFRKNLTACTLMCCTLGTCINDFSFFGERPFT